MARKQKVYDLRGDLSAVRLQTVDMSKKVGHKNNLRAWREFRGLTQEQLAEAVGSSKGVIGHLETARSDLSHKWLLKLAPVLGTTPGFLLDHDPNDMDTAFLDAALSVPRENRGQVLTILETFRKTGTTG